MAIKIVQCPKNPQEVGEFMETEFGPLLYEYLEREQHETGNPMQLDVAAFMAAWEQQGIKLIMAYDAENKAVGFMPCFVFRPLFMGGTFMVVERWFAKSEAIRDEMFKYLEQVVPILGLQQVHIADHPRHAAPTFLKYDDSDTYMMKRLEA